MIGPLIIDLDGVLRTWDPRIIANAETDHDLPAGALAAEAFANTTLLRDAVTGRITDTVWRQTIATNLATRHGDAAHHAVAQWSTPAGAINQDVLTIVRQQRTIRTVALLTNATTRLDNDLAALKLDTELDIIFNTAHIGHAKPDAAVYHHVCDTLNTTPDDCTFIDDTHTNVTAAAAIGMKSHHFTTAMALADYFASTTRHGPR